MTIHGPRIDSSWRRPARRWQGSRVYIARGVRFVSDVVGGLRMYAVRDLIHRRRLDDLLAAEPPVIVVRVVLRVIEAPIRRGFALSHILMLTLSRSAVALRVAITDGRTGPRTGPRGDGSVCAPRSHGRVRSVEPMTAVGLPLGGAAGGFV